MILKNKDKLENNAYEEGNNKYFINTKMVSNLFNPHTNKIENIIVSIPLVKSLT